MTDNRMAIVPRKVTKEIGHALESNIAECLPPSPVHAANWRDAWGNATAAAPNGGKVSREKVTHAAKAAAALRWPDLGKTVGLDVDVCEDVARAVIEALGLELEE